MPSKVFFKSQKPKDMPSVVPLSLLPACTLAFSFLTIASAFSLANESNPLNPRKPSCYPASGSAELPLLSEHDCLQALGEFERNLPFADAPILTHDPDKAHLPNYILAPARATYGDCMFRADIPPGNDARIDVQDLVYRANVLVAKCVEQAGFDGGLCSVEAEGAPIWINIDFRHLTYLTNMTNVDFGNITNVGLIMNSSTAETLRAPAAVPETAVVASG